MRKTTTRLAPALALGLLLAATPASAAPAPGALFDSVRGAFAHLWLRLGGVWGEVGVMIDPHGQPAPAPRAVWGEAGVEISPWGQPRSAPAGVQGEVSAMIDPLGQPSPAPAGVQGEVGVTIDPHG